MMMLTMTTFMAMMLTQCSATRTIPKWVSEIAAESAESEFESLWGWADTSINGSINAPNFKRDLEVMQTMRELTPLHSDMDIIWETVESQAKGITEGIEEALKEAEKPHSDKEAEKPHLEATWTKLSWKDKAKKAMKYAFALGKKKSKAKFQEMKAKAKQKLEDVKTLFKDMKEGWFELQTKAGEKKVYATLSYIKEHKKELYKRHMEETKKSWIALKDSFFKDFLVNPFKIHIRKPDTRPDCTTCKGKGISAIAGGIFRFDCEACGGEGKDTEKTIADDLMFQIRGPSYLQEPRPTKVKRRLSELHRRILEQTAYMQRERQ